VDLSRHRNEWGNHVKQDLALFKAFSDETRLRILFLLAVRELCVCELVSVLEMPQGKISRHLALLKQAGAVEDRRDGTWIYYSLPRFPSTLLNRLKPYLESGSSGGDPLQHDLERLKSPAEEGVVCVPNPAYTPVVSRN